MRNVYYVPPPGPRGTRGRGIIGRWWQRMRRPWLLRLDSHRLSVALTRFGPCTQFQGEGLTNWEFTHLSHGICPDCVGQALLAGPAGGIGRNVACSRCGSEFNASPLGATRSSTRGQPEVERLCAVYRLATPQLQSIRQLNGR